MSSLAASAERERREPERHGADGSGFERQEREQQEESRLEEEDGGELVLSTITIARTTGDSGKLHTCWELTPDITHGEAITALELTKLKLHHQMLKDLK